MKLTICGSMFSAKIMLEAKEYLEKKGFQVAVPEKVEEFVNNPNKKSELDMNKEELAERKIKFNLIKGHYNEVVNADAILITNIDKNGNKNYIGGNSFLEMGFAFVLEKKIYLYNPIPQDAPYYTELVAMQPIVLDGDLSKIG